MQRIRYIELLILLVLTTALFPIGVKAQGAVLVVDDDGWALPSDCDARKRAFTSIQAAVNTAAPGGTIVICPGVYDEQIVVTTSSLTLRGSGTGVTFLRPASLTFNSTGATNPFPVSPVLLINGAKNFKVSDLTVDGSLADSGAVITDCRLVGFITGIYYRNSSGDVSDVEIINFRSGTTCSSAMFVSSSLSTATQINVTSSRFANYGSEGLRCSGRNVSCSIRDNTFTGSGPVDNTIQGGIIFHLGAGGDASGNTITNHFYTPAQGIWDFAVGIALFNAEPNLQPHLLQNNLFSDNQINIQRQSTAQVVE